jgi:O-Antigen ligase
LEQNLFRVLFVVQALVLAIDLRTLLHHQGNFENIIQKALILVTGAAFILTRPMRRGVVALICAMVMTSFFCAMGSEYRGFEWRAYAGGVVSIIAPFILLAAEPDEQDCLLGLRVFAALPLLMVALGVIYAVFGISPLFMTDQLGALRLAASQGPAFLAAACLFGAFAALELADQRHIGYAVLVLINFIILVLTGGRMALALTLVVCAIAYLRGFQRFPLIKFFMPMYLFVCVGVFLAFYGSNLLRRIESASLMGREQLWAAMGRQLDAHPWFGVGLGNQIYLLPEHLVVASHNIISAHDEYLRMAVELGYPGAVVVFVLSLCIFYLVWTSGRVRRDPMFLVCVAAFYVYCVTDNALTTPQNFFILVAASFACGRHVKLVGIIRTPSGVVRPPDLTGSV